MSIWVCHNVVTSHSEQEVGSEDSCAGSISGLSFKLLQSSQGQSLNQRLLLNPIRLPFALPALPMI